MTTSMIDRRSLLAGAAALAITATVPEMSEAALTDEERELLALLPGHVTAEDRAFVLAELRNPDPIIRIFARRILRTMSRMTMPQRREFVAALEAACPDCVGSV